MQILSALGDRTEYTWTQALRFFLIGASKAGIYAMIPPAIAAWHNYRNYTDDVDWGLVWELAVGTGGMALYQYWQEHKALLKLPPGLIIPPEFEPSKTTVERSAHTTTTTRESDAGTTTTKLSEHTSKRVFEPVGTGDGNTPVE